MKSGVKTTEFWLTVLAQLLGLGVTFELITTGQIEAIIKSSDSLIAAITAFTAAVGPVLASLALAWDYISSRTNLKIEFEKIKAELTK